MVNLCTYGGSFTCAAGVVTSDSDCGFPTAQGGETAGQRRQLHRTCFVPRHACPYAPDLMPFVASSKLAEG